jgi:hypothetical protein
MYDAGMKIRRGEEGRAEQDRRVCEVQGMSDALTANTPDIRIREELHQRQ